jgi:hypothetical protein
MTFHVEFLKGGSWTPIHGLSSFQDRHNAESIVKLCAQFYPQFETRIREDYA